MSVCPSVVRSVIRSLFWHFASGFRVTAPAQSHVTDAVVYMATPTPHNTTPAQTHTTDTVMYMAVLRIGPKKPAKGPLEG